RPTWNTHSEQPDRHTTETTTSLQLLGFPESRPERLHGPSCRMPRKPRLSSPAITGHGGTQSGNGGMWRQTAKSANCSGKFSASFARSHPLFTQISRRFRLGWRTERMAEYVDINVGEEVARPQFAGGAMRDSQTGKPRFGLLPPEHVPYKDQ